MRFISSIRWRGVAAGVLLLGAGAAHAEPSQTLTPVPEKPAAPDFSLIDADGERHRLSDYRGKVFLLSFWSCYSDSCFTAVRVIGEYLEEFRDKGFAVLTVCSEVPPVLAEDTYEGLLARCSEGQTVLIDGDRAVTDRYRLHTSSMPVSFLVGSDFIVREIVSGPQRLHAPAFRKKIMMLLEGREMASP